MSDNLTQRGGSDRTRINVNQEHEVRYWAQRFGVSQEEVRNAVKAAGDRAEQVQAHLASHARKQSPTA
jgi:hypothetical protein